MRDEMLKMFEGKGKGEEFVFLRLAGWVILGIVLLSMGCQTGPRIGDYPLGADYRPENVHLAAAKIPDRVRRVAVLPMTVSEEHSDAIAGRDVLEPIYQSELDKVTTFEVVRVTPQQMKDLTGRPFWRADDEFPESFLPGLRKALACEAILFSELTRYHAYPPIAVGWSMKLVDVHDARIWWAADEVFDSAERSVVNSARRFELEHQKYYKAAPLLADSRTVLSSPRRFGRYSVNALLETLPER
ncbi:MAG: hypothetical protein SFY81_06515 [Verrucomicrobiota bacterium]|nr:hypothetical protein [Verrucomicrobiota bacterium]